MNKFILFLFIVCSNYVQDAFAQVYGNEWIKPNHVYYKFSVATNSIFRITNGSIQAVGIPSNVEGKHFQLIRNGVEVPIYTSTDNAFGSGDYIEFYGHKATPEIERKLYTKDSILNPYASIFSDTAVYFLTYDLTSTNNLRYASLPNTILNPPAKELFCYDTILRYNRTIASFIPGNVYDANEPYYSSLYEKEGFSFKRVTNANDSSLLISFVDAYKLSGAPSIKFQTKICSETSFSNHKLRFGIGGQIFIDTIYNGKQVIAVDRLVATSLLPTNNALRVRINPYGAISQSTPDIVSLPFIYFKYPRQFNFGTTNSLQEFSLPPKSSPYYLEVITFNDSAQQPILYDITNRKRYIGDKNVTGKVRFQLPSSNIEPYMVLANPKVYNTIASLELVNFPDYTSSSAQGDYLIITHPFYYNDGAGGNPIEDYRQYRSSNAGGNYSARTINVKDLYNEFGYGYNNSSIAIRSFMEYTNNNWTVIPRYAFYVGKALSYLSIMKYNTDIVNNPTLYPYIPVPTYGHPGADIFFTDFNYDRVPEIPFGRFSAHNGAEVRAYLDKIKEYDISNQISNLSLDEIIWKKKSLHIAGANDQSLQTTIISSLNSNANIIKGEKYGSANRLIRKETTNIIDIVNIASIDSLLNTGVGLIQFFGHSSSKSFDYGLDEPSKYDNFGKYNFFVANGCNAGEMFNLSPSKTITESFVAEPKRASICFIASSNVGYPGYLGQYTKLLYEQITECDGRTIGTMMKNVMSFLPKPSGNNFPPLALYAEYVMMNGDPAITFANYLKPDYVVDKKHFAIAPTIITTFNDSFEISLVVYNTARYTKDSVTLTATYKVPNGSHNPVFTKLYPQGIAFSDTISFKIPVNKIAAGLNSIKVTIDDGNIVSELSETNNTIDYDFYIYDDQLIPVFPQNFSIVNKPTTKLSAYTSNIFSSEKKYIMQIDTTANFNSLALQTYNIFSKGGAIQWQPNIVYKDSVVYYWRCAYDTIINGEKIWNTHSFVYLPNEGKGWNQSHYYQYKSDKYLNMYIDSNTRNLVFNGSSRKIGADICMFNMPPGYIWADFKTDLNGINLYTYTAATATSNTLQFTIIDSVYGIPLQNDTVGTTGKYGSVLPYGGRDNFFEFPFKTAANRKVIMDFIDSIPSGSYAMLIPFLNDPATASFKNRTFADSMKADTLIYGANNSLYHKLYNQGFTTLDSFYYNRPFFFFFKKNSTSYIPTQIMSTNPTAILQASATFAIPTTGGFITTDKIGPTKNWKHIYREFASVDINLGDSTFVEIFGLDSNNNSSLLATMYGKDTSLSFINANTYPFIQLKYSIIDNINATPTREKYWRVLYDPLPELVLSPNEILSFKDTFVQGEEYNLSIGIRNVSDVDADSVFMFYSVIDANNTNNPILSKMIPPIKADTIVASTALFNTIPFANANTLFIEANHNRVQQELIYSNNFGYIPFFVKKDIKNPLLDVTFDGIHILHKDLVSANPVIKIRLLDENKYLKLNDTNLFTLALGVPAKEGTNIYDTLKQIYFDNDTLKFFPATSDNKNEANIEYRPNFPYSGEYKLSVSAKDKTGNFATKDYTITFTVDTAKAVSNLLNYPNPFSTSTQFIFTLAGTHIPDNMRIRVYSVSGKLVREISKAELGNVHIGRNITDYRWDGTDQYGQKLANGVYFYQFIVSDDGAYLNKYYKDRSSSEMNKYFKNNMSKLYILR